MNASQHHPDGEPMRPGPSAQHDPPARSPRTRRQHRPPQEPAIRPQSPSDGESRYRPDPAQPAQKPLKVRIELRLVDGPEGKKLRARQAAAIREALRWFAEHHDPEQADPISQDRPETSR